MFAVLRLNSFNLETNIGLPVNIETKMIGFLPVYRTKEEALIDYPDGPIVEMVAKND